MSQGIFATPRDVRDPADCVFYHTMEIPGLGLVEGFFDLRSVVDQYLGPVDFVGKRVLEIGPASGFLTFEMEKRGADVVAVELSDEIPWDYVPYEHPEFDAWLVGQRDYMHKQRNGFWYAHAALGSKARVHYGSAYDLPEALGRFDVVTMAAVLLHNRDPMGIIANAAKHASETLIIVDQHAEDLDGATMRLVPARDNHMVHTWWNISPALIRQYLPVLGFEVVHESSHTEQFVPIPGRDESQPLAHFTIVATRRQ